MCEVAVTFVLRPDYVSEALRVFGTDLDYAVQLVTPPVVGGKQLTQLGRVQWGAPPRFGVADPLR